MKVRELTTDELNKFQPLRAAIVKAEQTFDQLNRDLEASRKILIMAEDALQSALNELQHKNLKLSDCGRFFIET